MDKKKVRALNKLKLSLQKSLEILVVSLICALLIIAPFFRGLYFRGDYLRSIACVGAIFVLYIILKVIRRDNQFFNSYLDLLILLLPIVYGISFFFAVNMKNALDVLLKYISYFMVYKLVSDCCGKENRNKYLTAAVILSAFIVSLTGLLAMAGKLDIKGAVMGGRIYGLYQYPNATASAIGAGILITVGQLINEKKMPLVLLYQVLLSTMLAGFLLTLSLGGFLVLAVLLLIFFIIVNYENKVSFIVSLIISVLSNGLIFIDYYKTGLKTNFIVYYLVSILVGLCLQFIYFKISRRFMSNIKRSTALLTSAGIVIASGLAGVGTLSFLGLLNAAALNKLWSAQLKLQNASDRIVFVKDGLKIFADNFLVGTGGGSWGDIYQKYQSFAYTSTEAHNFYIQVMTETGILGALVLGGIIAYLVWNFIKDIKNKNSSTLPIYMGIFMILGHAWLDFDLSYAALSLLLWTLVGMVSKVDNIKLGESINKSSLLNAAFALIGVFIIWSGTSMFMGMSYGNDASKLVNSKNINDAIPLYEKAMSMDKYNAAYRMDYAQIMSSKYKSEKDRAYLEKFVQSLNQIAKYEPYNEHYMPVIASLYLNNGMLDQGVSVTNDLVALQPLVVNAYVNKLQVNYEIAKYYFSKSQQDKALPYLENMIETERQLEAAKSKSIKPFEVPNKVYQLIGLAKNWKTNAEKIIEAKSKK